MGDAEIRCQEQGAGREYGDELKALCRVSVCAQHLRVQSAELDFGGVRSDRVLFQSAHPHVWPSARVPTSPHTTLLL